MALKAGLVADEAGSLNMRRNHDGSLNCSAGTQSEAGREGQGQGQASD